MCTLLSLCVFSLSTSSMVDLTQSWAQQVKAKGNNKKRKLQFSFILCNVTLNVTIYICFLLLMIIMTIMTICWRWSCWLVFFFIFEHTQKLAVSAESWTFFEWSCVWCSFTFRVFLRRETKTLQMISVGFLWCCLLWWFGDGAIESQPIYSPPIILYKGVLWILWLISNLVIFHTSNFCYWIWWRKDNLVVDQIRLIWIKCRGRELK